MDGIELSYLVREEFPTIRVVLLSAFNEFRYAQKAVSLGVMEYLTKPFTIEEVLATMRRVTARLEEEHRRRALLEAVDSADDRALPCPLLTSR